MTNPKLVDLLDVLDRIFPEVTSGVRCVAAVELMELMERTAA